MGNITEQETFIIYALFQAQSYRIKGNNTGRKKQYAWEDDKCTQNLSLNI
jgi:hypothetical protein